MRALGMHCPSESLGAGASVDELMKVAKSFALLEPSIKSTESSLAKVARPSHAPCTMPQAERRASMRLGPRATPLWLVALKTELEDPMRHRTQFLKGPFLCSAREISPYVRVGSVVPQPEVLQWSTPLVLAL